MTRAVPPAAGLAALDAAALGRMLRAGEVSAPEVLQATLDRIEEVDGLTRSHVHVAGDEARAAAEKAQARIDAARAAGNVGTLPAMTGIPVSLKDNLCVTGWPTTCGSRLLAGFRPTYDATVVRFLREAGAVPVGKTNLDEFAMGSTTETSCHPATANPHDLSRSPGGSSGGSAAAVAACEAVVALGSDTGGSVRQPASFCGVVGLKPTYGAVSRYGLVAFASSLDQIGPFGRTVADCAALFATIAGHDPRDATSVRPGSAGAAAMDALAGTWGTLPGNARGPRPAGMPDGDDSFPLRGVRVGIPDEYFCEGLDPAVRDRVLQAAARLESLGASCERFSLPVLAYGVPTYYIVACAEASSNLSRYDGVKYGFRAEGAQDLSDLYVRTRSEGFGLEAKRRILLGNFVLSAGYYDAYYDKAMRVRTLVRRGLDAALSRFDLLLGPVSPTTAPLLGESLKDPLKMYLSDICTVSANLAGLPALSLPCGTDDAGLPVGVQMIGPRFGEAGLLGAAAALEAAQAGTQTAQGRTEV